jgi:hypothetical protein
VKGVALATMHFNSDQFDELLDAIRGVATATDDQGRCGDAEPDFSGVESMLERIADGLDALSAQSVLRLDPLHSLVRKSVKGLMKLQQEQSTTHVLDFAVVPTPTVPHDKYFLDRDGQRLFMHPRMLTLLRETPYEGLLWSLQQFRTEPRKHVEFLREWKEGPQSQYASLAVPPPKMRLFVDDVQLFQRVGGARLCFTLRSEIPMELFVGRDPCKTRLAHVPDTRPAEIRQCASWMQRCWHCNLEYACPRCIETYFPKDNRHCQQCIDAELAKERADTALMIQCRPRKVARRAPPGEADEEEAGNPPSLPLPDVGEIQPL